MSFASMVLWAALSLMLAQSTTVPDTSEPLETDLSEQIEVRFVIIDALVLDSQGAIVTDLGLDDFKIPARIHSAFHVDNTVVREAPENVGNRIHIPDVREEHVSKPLALACAAREPSDIDELEDWLGQLLRHDDLPELGEPLILHIHDGNIRLYSTIGVIACGGL